MPKKRTWKLPALAVLPITLLLAGCGQQQTTSSASDAAAPAPTSKFSGGSTVPAAVDKPLTVALVIRTTQGGWLEDYTKTIQSEVTALGGKLQIYDSQNDLGEMATNLTTAVNSHANIILIDNGTAAALDGPVKAALAEKIPVVAYDSDFVLPGVGSINQNDTALATNSIAELDKDFDGNANIVVLSVAGYTPLDNRLAALKTYLGSHPGIKIVAQTGTVSSTASLDTEAQVEALLKANPKPGEINAIWTDWNDFSVGAALALKAEDRSDVKLYTVDLTDQNLPFFWDPVAHLEAVSASNPATIAIAQVRLAYEKAAGENVSDVTVQPVTVTKGELPKTAFPFSAVSKYVPGWDSDPIVWPAWIQALEKQHT
ncbi:MAG: substrate-binding domain-containing protein [Solirubrobacteraceae bacterium]